MRAADLYGGARLAIRPVGRTVLTVSFIGGLACGTLPALAVGAPTAECTAAASRVAAAAGGSVGTFWTEYTIEVPRVPQASFSCTNNFTVVGTGKGLTAPVASVLAAVAP